MEPKVAAIGEIFARDARVEDPVGSQPISGIDAMLESYGNAIFPQVFGAELTGPVRCPANAAAFSFRVRSTGADPSGTPLITEIIDVFEFDGEGRVASMKAYWTPY
jgi:steroid delta-isomerase